MANSSYAELDINQVEVDVDNPRIKMFLENYKIVKAEDIALALNGPSSDGTFNALRESIRVNGGIINPILVNHTEENRYVVIEGNTRLQIYKDFAANRMEGDWGKIRAIVYENLSEEDIHSIRLQCHLVGPRDWDAYSKAKYLHYLMYEKRLPIASIISYCGGKKNEINKLVAAYKDMQNYYLPKAEELGYDVDYKDFSKFSELQNKGIIEALQYNGFSKSDYSSWVLDGKVDTAQNVRLLPVILKCKEAKAEFLKSNIKEAYKRVNVSTTTTDISSMEYFELCKVLTNKLDKIELKDANFLKTEEGYEKKSALLSLRDSIDFVLQENAYED